MSNTQLIRKIILEIFDKYSKLPDYIKKYLFKKRFLFNTADCIKYGLCDAIITCH